MAKPVLADLVFDGTAKITGLPTPVAPSDAATKAYVDASGGGSAITVQDEGSNITTALATLNFVGAGVTVTGGATATVTIPGGGGNGPSPILAWAI